MNGIMNQNQLTVVKEYEFDNPLIQNIDSIINKRYRDCHKNIITHLNMNVYTILILQMTLIMK